MKVYIGADHRGYELKTRLIEHLRRSGHEIVDVGDKQLDPDDDFPEFASRLANKLLSDGSTDPRGILICGSGQGMAMAANRFKGIRAALSWNQDSARESRNDDNSNVLCLPANDLKESSAEQIVETWLRTPFAAAPKYIRRLNQIDNF